MKRYEDVKRLCEYIAENHPDSDFAIKARASVAGADILLGNDAAAQAGIDGLIADFNDNPKLPGEIYKIEAQYWHIKRYEEVKRLCEYIAENHPDSDFAIKARASVAAADLLLGNDAAAQTGVDALTRDFAEDPELAGMLCKLGNISCEGGKYDRAAELYQYVIDTWPKSTDAMWAQMNLAKLYIDLRNDPNVHSALDKLIADFNDQPDLPQAVFQIAEQHFYGQSYREAIELWELVLSEYPESYLTSEIPYLLATCYNRIDNYEKAIQYYKKVVERYPDSRYGWRAPYRLGIMYRRLKDYDQSVYWFEQQRNLYSNESTSQQALFWQGNIFLFDMKDYQKAVEKFQEYIELYPESEGSPEVCYDLAMAYEKIGDKTQAIALLQEAQSLYPNSIFTQHITDKLAELQEGVKQ